MAATHWLSEAVCREVDPELFFGDTFHDVALARQVCARCPVIEECLEDAFATDDTYATGVRGGLTGKQRTAMRLAQQRAAA
jgi:WhiB family redox-sensing transcriptional regulator